MFCAWFIFLVVYTVCEENPCKNGGSCIAEGGTFSCGCTYGYGGFYCDQVTPNSPPFFTDSPSIDTVPEDTLPGTLLHTFTASDSDGDTVFFFLGDFNGKELFSIGSTTGRLILAQALDREQNEVYFLDVRIRDETNQTASMSELLLVEDVNDNAPVFEANYTINVTENSSTGIRLLEVIADDADKGINGIVVFSVQKIEANTAAAVPSDLFAISSTGWLTLENDLDFEVAQEYFITVIAKDSGTPYLNSSTVVTVIVEDLQDSPPAFSNSSYDTSISETTPENSLVVTISAFDQDVGNPNEIQYTIVSGNDEDYFIIIPILTNGYLSLSKQLDREDLSKPDSFTLTVRAQEVSSQSSFADTTFNITVLDVVDESPYFDTSIYFVQIPEEEPSGTTLSSSLIVYDGEQTAHTVLHLELINPDNFPFALTNTVLANGGTTSLRTTDVLDYEENPSYILTVNVSKTNTETKQLFTASAMVIVGIEDINDNRPVFTQEIYEVPLTEGLPVGTPFLQLEATDADSDQYSNIIYSFASTSSVQNNLILEDYFNISSTTGLITTTVVFDFETHPTTIDFFVFATNVNPFVGVGPGIDSALVRVLLQDANDNPPIFEQSSYSICIPENAGPISVTDLTATDEDVGSSGMVEYYIISDNPFGFSIDKTTGNVAVGDSLDRESQNYHNLTILANDLGEPPLSATVMLFICVSDVNDNKPQWVLESQVFNLSENTLPGPVGAVEAFDLDEGRNADLLYQIVPNNPNFVIDTQSGEISLIGSLDRETESIVNLTIVVRDEGNPQLTSDRPATVSILVLDVNDNDPVFTSANYDFYINENFAASLLTNVGMVSATDADTNIVTSYNFVNPADFEGFTMNPSSGTILTNQLFDREEKAVYQGMVQAIDGAREAFTSVTIRIRDENDNHPVFAEEEYITTIMEGAAASVFLNVTATDIDEGGNGTVTYSFKSGEQVESSFFLNPQTGELSTTASLDREQQAIYQLTVVARDHPEYGAPLEAEVMVVIAVMDINDNPPSFLNTLYQLDVFENATETDDLIKITASDEDEGVNSFVNYRIVQGDSGNHFRVGNTTGILRVALPLDRETLPSYTLVVEAFNPAVTNSSTDVASILITVLDVNDETPDFSQEIYSRPDLLETSRSGSPVVTVMATDPDSGSGGQVTYDIVDGNSQGFFTISALTGLITTNGFLPQVESSMTFNISLSATDGAPPYHMAYATALITIVHASEVTPVFLQEVYTVNITENLPANTTVVQVEADVNGRADAVIYSLDTFNPSASAYFIIDEFTGLIVTKKPLDREAMSSFSYTAFARNGDSSFGSAAVLVNVLDVNDNSPKFESIVSDLIVLEGLPSGVLVTEIKSSDADLGVNAMVSYEILAGNMDDAFVLVNPNNVTSMILTTGPLDREAVASYQLVIQAVDGGQPPLSSRLEVDVTVGDVNDNPPLFSHSVYNGSVVEERFSSEPILLLSVVDADLFGTNDYSFTFAFGNEDSKFTISEEGELIQTNLFDREEKDVYRLGIILKDESFDPSFQATAEVEITVTDINDNSPVFSPSSYTVNVTEGAVPSQIVTLFASDADVGVNGEFTFNLTGPFTDLFYIDPLEGILSTTEVLDRETRPEYSIIITATDHALDPDKRLTGIATVTVLIQDVNDSPPMFAESYLGPFEVMEGSSGYYILSLMASDPDDVSTVITYSLTGLHTEFFDLDAMTGVLTTKTDLSLDYETFQELNITVAAEDQDNLRSTVTVGIVVVNVNDNDPIFLEAPYNISLRENSTVGTVKFVAVAMDADLGPDGEVTYSIQSGNQENAFWINTQSGEIFLNKSLDRETTPSYDLVIQASDNPREAVDIRFVTTTLSITVSDLDDSAPAFPMSMFSGSLSESAPGRSDIAMNPPIMAVDADVLSQLVYTISGVDSLLFEINSQSGMLKLSSTAELDYERQTVYRFAVIATDSRGRTAEANVTVNVENENDNEPKFTETSLNFTVPENSLPGVFVGEVAAVDADGDRLRFALIQGAEGQFVLDPDTGFINVSTDANLDREVKSVYELRATVTDQSFTTEGTVYIHVTDINDSPPVFPEAEVSLVLPEDHVLSEPLYVVEAQDLDSDATLVYFIESFSVIDANFVDITKDANIFSWFVLNATTGKLRLMMAVDRESISSIVLRIRATDVNGEDGRDVSDPSLKLMIEIGDVNDNAPEFQPSNATALLFQAQEESGTNTIIATLVAADPDQGAAGEVEFFVGPRENESLPFSVDARTGNVRIESPIDREQTAWVNFTVVAADLGRPSLNTTIPVAVKITDINDNNPSFEELLYIFMVNESSLPPQVVATVTALDPDEGDFGTVRYSLSGGDGVFTIDQESGEISLLTVLDRETIHQYLLTVIARDNPEGSSNNKRETSVMVVIEVTDVNEFSPEPSMPIYIFSVPEGTPPGSEVGKIEATDPDNPNQMFIFSVQESSSPGWESVFSLDSMTGSILLTADIGNSNNTLSPSYLLLIQISDGGNPEQVTMVDAILTIKAFNKNPPIFDQRILNVSIPEDFITGLPVAMVTAFDPDEEGDVIYSIQDQSQSLFAISDNGEVRFLGSLDHETEPFYTLGVTAEDLDGLTANATVNIVVTDVNDNPPVFSREQYNFEVLENLPNGTFIGKIVSSDADTNPDNKETVYQILTGARDFVTIDEVTGDITVNQPIDREMIGTLSLKVEAENTRPGPRVELKSRTDVIITVLDANDNPPIFEDDLYEESLLETTPPGSFILEVAATDADEGENAVFTYSIIDGDNLGFFRIDPISGRVFVNKSLADHPDLFLQQVRMTIAATDRGATPLTGTTVAVINITDANNNRPVFVVPHPGQSLQLPENQPFPHFIAKVEARDADLGLNGEVRYGLLADGLDSHFFTIDPDTGELSAAFTADREVKDVYTIVLQATDRGENPVPTSVEIAVTVTDENDNMPAFTRLADNTPIVQTMTVQENANISTVVGRVTPAVDADTGENAIINYFIVDGNSGGLFSMDPSTGEIIVVKNIDRETAGSHQLIVKASNDEGVTDPPPNAQVLHNILEDRSLKEVLITVTDVNDNGPIFGSSLVTIGISLLVDRFSEVAQINAVDPDLAGAGITKYYIKQTMFTRDDVSQEEFDLFSIEEDTGIISNLRFFEDAHTTGFFDVTVEAVDSETKQTDETVVRVYVLDLNQQIILVINSPVNEVNAKKEALAKLLSELTGGDVQIDDVSVLATETGTDDTRSMVTLYVIDPDTNLILDADTVIKSLDKSPMSVEELFVQESIRDIYPLVGDQVQTMFGTLGISLLAIALLLLFGNTLFIIILCCLRWRYLRMLTGGLQSGVLYSKGSIRTDLNATEISSFGGSNPAFDSDGSLGDWPTSRSDIAGREAVEASMQFLSSEIASSAPGDVIMTSFVSEKALKGDYTQGIRYGSKGSPPGAGRNMLGSLNSLRSEGSGASASSSYEPRSYGSKSNSPPGGKKYNKGSVSTSQAAQSFAEYQRSHGGDRRGSLIKIDENEDTFRPREQSTAERGDPTAEIRRILQELTDDGKPSPSGISYDSSSSQAAMEAYRDQLEYDNELTPITENDEDALSSFSSRRGSERLVDPMEISFELDVDGMTPRNKSEKFTDRRTDPNRLLAIKNSPSKTIYTGENNNLPPEVHHAGTNAQAKRQFKDFRESAESEAKGHAAIVRQLTDDEDEDEGPLIRTASAVPNGHRQPTHGRVPIEDDSDSDDSSNSSDFELEEIPGLSSSGQTGKNSGFYEVQTKV
ncbi:cadherin-23-like isoform X1 [Apostichopus japonicus]|uniref:cadherin-23-like isoform X1 n=1 Tax=Stichopus japonicus TaxID=307972 RepID=UPI003AB2BB76